MNLPAYEAHRTYEVEWAWELAANEPWNGKSRHDGENTAYETKFRFVRLHAVGVTYIAYKAVMELTSNRVVTHKQSVVGPLDYRPYEPQNLRAYVLSLWPGTNIYTERQRAAWIDFVSYLLPWWKWNASLYVPSFRLAVRCTVSHQVAWIWLCETHCLYFLTGIVLTL